MDRRVILQALALAICAVGVSGLAGCMHRSPEPVIRDRLIEKTATVEAIHKSARMIALRGDDGVRSAVIVGPEVGNLDQVKVGDHVTVSYYEGLAAQVKKPGTGVRGVEEKTSTVRVPTSERPAGGIGKAVRTTVMIESVDTSANTVTFRRQDGLVRTLAVQSPEGRRFIKGLRRGDEVEVTYTEAVAVAVRPAG